MLQLYTYVLTSYIYDPAQTNDQYSLFHVLMLIFSVITSSEDRASCLIVQLLNYHLCRKLEANAFILVCYYIIINNTDSFLVHQQLNCIHTLNSLYRCNLIQLQLHTGNLGLVSIPPFSSTYATCIHTTHYQHAFLIDISTPLYILGIDQLTQC